MNTISVGPGQIEGWRMCAEKDALWGTTKRHRELRTILRGIADHASLYGTVSEKQLHAANEMLGYRVHPTVVLAEEEALRWMKLRVAAHEYKVPYGTIFGWTKDGSVLARKPSGRNKQVERNSLERKLESYKRMGERQSPTKVLPEPTVVEPVVLIVEERPKMFQWVRNLFKKAA